LDLDGCINDHTYDPIANSNTLDKDKVDLLNQILKETGAYIVLSSAWRYLVHRKEMSLVGLNWLLRSHGVMDGRLVDVIGPDTMIPCDTNFNGIPGTWPIENERGLQITKWIASQSTKPEKYLVIDDLDLGINEERHPFLHINSSKGLTEFDAQVAIKYLNY
jgi:hypothetical protein